MDQISNLLWVEKYAPQTINDIVIPNSLKDIFNSMVEKGQIQNMILAGTQGSGKTTVAKVLCKTLGYDYILINASCDLNIDALRNQIKTFASTVSLVSNGHKVVILDEIDASNAIHTQPALRAFIEEFSKNCRFILTCNYPEKIIEPLKSRCSVIDFSFKDKEKLMVEFAKRMSNILENENVNYDRRALATLISKNYPDFRRIINICQKYAPVGIDSSLLVNETGGFESLISLMKDKKYTDIRSHLTAHTITNEIFNRFYKDLPSFITVRSMANITLIIAKYQYQAPFCANQEINICACIVEIMMNAEWL